MGHIGRNCPLSNKNKETKKDDGNASSSVAFSANSNQQTYDNVKHKMLMVDKFKTSKNEWILDSGATDHVSGAKEKFKNFKNCKIEIEVAGGSSIFAEGVGDIECKLSEENGNVNLTLLNVLYIPKLETNLISISQASKKGM